MTDADDLAVLVHELRSPVAALQALEETMRLAGGDLPLAERQRLLELAVAAGRDVERLLADPDLFSVEAVDVDAAKVLAPLARGNVEVDVEPGLAVHADPVRIRQAVANIVANGLRHGTRVTVRARAREGSAHIAITDDGPGVEPGVDVFARGVSGAGSSGFGLYVARAIAEAHGGRLELRSDPGAGATFTLVLPLASGAAG